ncbi:unnamed protein product [Cylicocyclus nassatus]|uniref:Uncharacterized protein n=1 Tax=Cylicocyclus nassatus TaxID=53992 RepID=A0AA36DP66_CYLNA|nr:unnamed protein product [Cylicocyclus nassatus]
MHGRTSVCMSYEISCVGGAQNFQDEVKFVSDRYQSGNIDIYLRRECFDGQRRVVISRTNVNVVVIFVHRYICAFAVL